MLTGEAAYLARYSSWAAAGGLGAKVGAFVDGSANFLKALGIPTGVAVALMGVLVASFAGTTLDTACRLQRYVIQELARTFSVKDAEGRPTGDSGPAALLMNKHGATIFAVVVAFAIAVLPKPGAEWSMATAGTGGLILWPLFGATNQLLAGLALLVTSFWLWRRGMPVWFVTVPMLFMLAMPAWAMLSQLPSWINPETGSTNWVVVIIAVATVVLEFWMVIEAYLLWPKAKGVLEEALPPLGARLATENEPTTEGGRSC
jgi:carbon starvation protein